MKKRVSGFLREKDRKYHTVITYYDSDGRRHIRTKSTGILIFNEKGKRIKKNEEEAKKILYKLKEEYEQKIENGILFTDYFLEHLKRKKYDMTESSYYKYYIAVTNRILPCFENISLKDLNVNHLKNYIYKLKEKGLSNNTIKHYIIYISEMLKEAVNDGLIKENIAKKIKLKKIEQKEIRALSFEEIEVLLNNVKGTRYELPIVLGLRYGLRLSEAFGLKWSSIDFQQKIIKIETSVTRSAILIDVDDNKSSKYNIFGQGKKLTERQKIKTKLKTESSRRTLYLEKNLEELLLKKRENIEEQRKQLGNTYCYEYEEFVLVNDFGKMMNSSYISKEISKIMKTNNINNASFKSLRSTFATMLFTLGVDLLTVMYLMGHSTLETTRRYYIKFNFEKCKKSMEVLNEELKKLNIMKKEEIISDMIGSHDDITSSFPVVKK